MDHELARLMDNDTPKLNPLLANGLATEHLKYAEQYVDQVFLSVSKGFPEGLQYIKGERCTPPEEYKKVTKKKSANNKCSFDVARSDIYMMKYLFKYKGVDLPPRYIYLPFVSDAGCIVLGGSRFNISPILSDRVISVGAADIFIRLLKARLTFKRQQQHLLINGVRETYQVAWSEIHNNYKKLKKPKSIVKANTTLMHYLLCKYGFTDTFLKFGNCRPIVGGPEINTNTYSPDEWSICSSTQVPPKGRPKGVYERPTITIAVRNEEMTPMVRQMLCGFFYIVDHFPSRIQPAYVDHVNLWKILMGHLIPFNNQGEGKLHDDVDDHIKSLDEFIDNLTALKMKEIGMNVTDVYQLFAMIIEKFNDWLLGATDKVASMYDKELSILYYVLNEITSAINLLYFKLKAASKKELSEKEITTMMDATLRTGLIYSITKQHGEVSTSSSPGDNKAFKITATLVAQSDSKRTGKRSDRAVLTDPTKRLHVSIAEFGGYSNLPKSAPDGRARLNHVAKIDSSGLMVRNPERAPMLDSIQELIKR